MEKQDIGNYVKTLISPVTYVVMDNISRIDVDTSSGFPTIITLQPIDGNSIRGKIYVNDISDNAGTGNIIIQCSGGNLINNAPFITLDIDGDGAEIEIVDKTRFLANLNSDTLNPSVGGMSLFSLQVNKETTDDSVTTTVNLSFTPKLIKCIAITPTTPSQSVGMADVAGNQFCTNDQLYGSASQLAINRDGGANGWNLAALNFTSNSVDLAFIKIFSGSNVQYLIEIMG